LIYISERRDRRERLRNRRYDDVLQFGDKYVDAMESQGQLLSQWQAADDRKLRQLEAEVAKLCEVMGKFDFREEIADLRQELLKAGTAAEVLEIRKRYDDLVEKINLLASQWRAVADLQLADFNREIMEMRRRIQEVERKQEEL
jgi:hypothetical protein